jgi:NAD(P)-dependent dehydrogenase (short-subunit alcohol dehydrogenase family)
MKKSVQNSFSLKDKVVVITGAAGLLGQQHARVVSEAGGTPILLDINSEVVVIAEKIAVELKVPAKGFQIDLTDESSVALNAKTLLDKYKKIDALVNNAANNPKMENEEGENFSRLENFSLEIWNSDLAVGLTGSFLCAKHYGTAISKNTNGGVILNISSDLGLIAPDQRLYQITGLNEKQQPVKPVTYSVVKTGLIGLTRYLATYWPNQVRCNALCPGGVENGQSMEFINDVCDRIPMGRLAQPDEYCGAVLFLLSEASAYLNGAIIAMDGGRTVW